MAIIKGATPTLTFTFTDTDLAEADDVLLSFSVPNAEDPFLEKGKDDMTIHTDTIGGEEVLLVDVFLNQAETLAMPKVCNAQFNFTFYDGEIPYRVPSVIAQIAWSRNLHNKVIEVTT